MFGQNRAKTEIFLRAMLEKGPSGQPPPARVDLSLLAPAAFSPSPAPVLTETRNMGFMGYQTAITFLPLGRFL